MTGTITTEKLTSIVSSSAAGVKRLWEPLWRILSFSLTDDTIAPAKNVSVSIEKGFLSVAYGSRVLSRIRIKGFKLYSLDGKYPSPESLASSVKVALSELGTPKKDITLSIPKAWTVIKIAEFPSTVKENISDVVSYEMDRLTPFSPEEALYDFKLLKEDTERLTLLVVAVKADVIIPYIEALREKGYNVTRVTMNLCGAGTLCRYIDKCTDSVFVRISENEYEGAVFSGGFITSAFTGSFGAGDERSKLDTIMSEIEHFREKAGKQGKSPQIIVSLKDKGSPLREMLKQRITTPIKILEAADVTLGLPLEEIPYEAVGGILESLWPKAKGLNLLKKGHQERAKTPVVLTLILMAAIVAMWVFYIFAPLSIEEKRLKEIERQVMMRKEEVRKVEALKKEIDSLGKEISTIKDFKETRPMALDILKEITSVLPRMAWLTRVRITWTTVEIEGYASSSTELLPKLEASRYLKKAEFASPTFRDVRQNAERFNIKMEIEGVKKDEGEKSKIEKK